MTIPGVRLSLFKPEVIHPAPRTPMRYPPLSARLLKLSGAHEQGHRHEVSTGGGGGPIPTGGQIQVSQNPLPLNSDFSSDFGHLILEILKSLKNLAKVFF